MRGFWSHSCFPDNTSADMRPLSKDEVDRILDNNLVEEFDKLAATPGYVLKPMPFQRVSLLQ